MAIPLFLLMFAVALPCLALYTVFNFFKGIWLRFRFRRRWGKNGKSILFVYSESPNWQQYIEREILPELAPHTVLLNYSKRHEWARKMPLEAKIWEHWTGGRDYNPVAILIPKRGKITTIPFYTAFRDFKHGKDKLLREKERELKDWIARIDRRR